ncbi:YceI family protein [Massilia sp. CF038]|jgi:polyisoprenoid-binding protein YceI|uniref:YceI family protein n=1 Tax=Massilia sp. CF038 TaxID=1881045 RepID=UPI00091AB966|nr:YceI family protein [Massilia sp. CF038]SHH56247.1 Polyisoprenoid-binding protein YceI [Massilia sp. CF038]
MKIQSLIAVLIATSAASAMAAPDTYTIDPAHTYPSFEADHMGLSYWRGKYKKTSGTVVLDRAAKTGSVNIDIDAGSIDFGLDAMNAHAVKEDIFDVAKYPKITYKSKSVTFKGEDPMSIEGDLTLHGVTKPVTLIITKFKCIMHPMHKKEVCGADASAVFNRADFGVTKGIPMFSPEVRLAIQVEAIKN